MKQLKKVLTILFVLALAFSLTPVSGQAAAKKVKLNKTKVTLNIGKKLQLKVKNLKKEQKDLGANVSENLDATIKYTWNSGEGEQIEIIEEYQWNDEGRLVGIEWDGRKLKGNISFSALTALTTLECDMQRKELPSATYFYV